MSDVENVDVRLLTAADLDNAFALSATAGWNQRRQDWLMLLDLAPSGSFAAAIGDRIVGTAIGIDYGAFGWIAMMLVDPAQRGKGLGARLLEAAIGAVPPDLPIRLDATPLGRPLYQRYGFDDEVLLTRCIAESPCAPGADPLLAPVRSLTSADLPGIVRRDPGIFRGRRAAILEWAFEHGPQYAFVAADGSGTGGYCLGREGRVFDQIGPIVAPGADVARALVSAALRSSGTRPIVVDAYDAGAGFTSFLHNCGFQPQRPLYRMCRRGRTPLPAIDADGLTEFGILGPEFG
jgi:GNAT superfamily N-acetyltransferase